MHQSLRECRIAGAMCAFSTQHREVVNGPIRYPGQTGPRKVDRATLMCHCGVLCDCIFLSNGAFLLIN